MRRVAVFVLAASSVSRRSTPRIRLDASALRNQLAPELVCFRTQVVRCADLDGDRQPALAVTRFTFSATGDLRPGVELVEFRARGLDGAKLAATCVLDDYIAR